MSDREREKFKIQTCLCLQEFQDYAQTLALFKIPECNESGNYHETVTEIAWTLLYAEPSRLSQDYIRYSQRAN